MRQKIVILVLCIGSTFIGLAQNDSSNNSIYWIDSSGEIGSSEVIVPEGLIEIAYDDGSQEGGVMVGSPASEVRYAAIRMTMPEQGTIHEISTFIAVADMAMDFNDVFICADDGTGLPDIDTIYESFGITTIVNTSYVWRDFNLTNPLALNEDDEFWIVLEWAQINEFPYGPFIGVDSTTPLTDRNYYSSVLGTWVLYETGNMMIRAYYEPELGTEERFLKNTYVYPNPANDVLNINSIVELRTIELINSLGQVVLRNEVNDFNIQVSTSNFDSGMYILRITSESGTINKTVIVN